MACCSPWGCKELDMTERLNWTETGSQNLFPQGSRGQRRLVSQLGNPSCTQILPPSPAPGSTADKSPPQIECPSEDTKMESKLVGVKYEQRAVAEEVFEEEGVGRKGREILVYLAQDT